MDNSKFQEQVLKQQRFQSTMSGLQTSMSVLQTAAAAHMSRQLSEMRRQNADALALQQQMMEQEQLQAEIEEFIYSAQNTLSSYDAPDCSLSLGERYFGVRSLLKSVKEWGLATPLIRGRDNKAAFEAMIRHAQKSFTQLQLEPDVKEAIAQEKAEQERLKRERTNSR